MYQYSIKHQTKRFRITYDDFIIWDQHILSDEAFEDKMLLYDALNGDEPAKEKFLGIIKKLKKPSC